MLDKYSQDEAEDRDANAQWHIVEFVPLPGPPSLPAPAQAVEADIVERADLPAGFGQRNPPSRPLFQDLDTLLTQQPFAQPLGPEETPEALAQRARAAARRRRRRLLRRVRRMAVAALVGGVLGLVAAFLIWWLAPTLLIWPPSIHFGGMIPLPR